MKILIFVLSLVVAQANAAENVSLECFCSTYASRDGQDVQLKAVQKFGVRATAAARILQIRSGLTIQTAVKIARSIGSGVKLFLDDSSQSDDTFVELLTQQCLAAERLPENFNCKVLVLHKFNIN